MLFKVLLPPQHDSVHNFLGWPAPRGTALRRISVKDNGLDSTAIGRNSTMPPGGKKTLCREPERLKASS
jgi:hypothetical protein